jgi:apolipoprotein D and lipocalin family protein
MLTRVLHRLEHEIRASEARVVECDRRAAASARAFGDAAGRALSVKLLAGAGLVAAGWLLHRPRARASRAALPPRGGLRMALLRAQRWLPLLLPLAAPLLDRKVVRLLAFAGLPVKVRKLAPLMTVPALDLRAFAGLWFEIARLPGWRDAPGRHDATLHYRIDDDGSVTLTQRWIEADGQPHGKLGRLRRPSTQRPGELETSMAPPWLRWWPGVWDDHWVIYVERDYRCALIGSPERDSLWLLAREPALPDDAVRALLTLAGRLGFDSARVQRTPHA